MNKTTNDITYKMNDKENLSIPKYHKFKIYFIDYIDIVALVGKYTVNLFVVLTTLEFAPNNT